MAFLAVLVLSGLPVLGQELPKAADVVIVGGSSTGIGAGIGAARLGVSVVLVEDTPVLGGMLSNGISNIDSYSYESLSGVFEEFRLSVKEHYRRTRPDDSFLAPRPRNIRHIDGRSFAAHEASEGGRWEPHVAQRIFRDMAAKYANLRVLYNTRATGVVMDGRRIAGVRFRNTAGEFTIMARAVVDATHEGDIAAWAGAPYRLGREARSELEPHAGHIYYYNGTNEILPGSTGRQDSAIPSSGLRLCVQSYPSGSGGGHVLKAPPPGYDPREFRQSPGQLSTQMPGGKFEMNVNPIGNELQEVNWSWPEATHEERQQLYELHRDRALAYLFYLQHELGRKQYGLPADEFKDNGNVPYRIFLREGRRIEGDEMMTEADVNPFVTGAGWIPKLRPNSIAVGHYPIDAKPVRPKTDMTRPDKGEGDFYLIDVSTAFQVPYGSVLPRGVEGLLVPAALSATHVAFSAVRMDPTWTVLGQSAGVAAALGVKLALSPREVSIPRLQEELLLQKVRLVFYWDLPLDHPAFTAIQRLSLDGVISGDPDRTVRPDAPLTRAEVAALLARYFKWWPSVSGHHFSDVPHTHWAFRDVETMHNRELLPILGLPPLWPEVGGYEGARHAGFAKLQKQRLFRPADRVTWHEWRQLLTRSGVAANQLGAVPQAREHQAISRAEAAVELFRLETIEVAAR